MTGVPVKSAVIPASAMLIAPTEIKPPPAVQSASSPNNKLFKTFQWPCNKPAPTKRTNLNPTPWRARRSRQEQTNQSLNYRNRVKDQATIANYNWRMPSPQQSQAQPSWKIFNLKVVAPPPQMEVNVESPEHKTEKSALCESKNFRIRCLSESSQVKLEIN